MNEENNIIEEKPIESMVEKVTETCKPKCFGMFFKVLAVLSLLGVITLFILWFLKDKPEEITATKTVSNATFAFVNTDTIMAKYDFVTDMAEGLTEFDKTLQAQYNSTVAAFKKEYDDYIKRASAGLLTLEQQKRTEEILGAKQQNIGEMESELAMRSQEEKLKKNMEVSDTIVSYIKRYNKTKDYTFIFQQSYGGSLLYANPALDITNEVLKALNEEYNNAKKKGSTVKEEEKKDDKK